MKRDQVIYFFFILIMLHGAVFMTIPLAAAGDGGWATVDTRILLMLHPQMSGFDYSNGRFFRNPDDKNIEKAVAELKTAQETAAKQSAPLKEQQMKLMQQKFELNQQVTRAEGIPAPGDIEDFRREKALLEASIEEVNRQKPANREAERLFSARKVDLQQRLDIINGRLAGTVDSKASEATLKELHQKIAKLDADMKTVATQLTDIEEKSMSAMYLNSEETAKRLTTINDEINELIRKAADESKIAVVIDNSFAMRSPQRKEKLKMIPATDEAPDVVSSALFHSFNNLTIDPELAANLTRDDNTPLPPEHLVVGRAIGMQSNLTQYLEFRNYLPEKVTGFSHGRMIISGGTDLTPWVARQLFDRYKIPDSVKNSFMQALRGYLDFEKEPAVREREY